MRTSSPFGSQSRTRILLALSGLEFSYPRALARRLDSPIFAVRKALEGLERDGLVTSRLVGRTRVYTLDATYVAYKELAAYLARLARAEAEASGERQPAPGRESAGGLVVAGSPPAPGGPVEKPPRPRPAPQPPDDDGWRNW